MVSQSFIDFVDEPKVPLSELKPAECDVEGCSSVIESASHQIYLAQVVINSSIFSFNLKIIILILVVWLCDL